MRALRINANRAGKSRAALLGTRTVPCDAILGDFVAFKHSSKANAKIMFSVQTFVFYFVLTSSSECS